jgi:hypothetical protein
MPHQVKLIFTCETILIAIGVLCINPRANNAKPEGLWLGGRNGSLRNLLCRPDGTLRKYTKPAILLGFALFLALLWLFAPDK